MATLNLVEDWEILRRVHTSGDDFPTTPNLHEAIERLIRAVSILVAVQAGSEMGEVTGDLPHDWVPPKFTLTPTVIPKDKRFEWIMTVGWKDIKGPAFIETPPCKTMEECMQSLYARVRGLIQENQKDHETEAVYAEEALRRHRARAEALRRVTLQMGDYNPNQPILPISAANPPEKPKNEDAGFY